MNLEPVLPSVQEILDYFTGFDGWVTAHVLFPYAIAVATKSRSLGLVSAYLYETLTVLLAATGHDIGFTGAVEGLVQDPALALIGVSMASRSSHDIAAKKHWNWSGGLVLVVMVVCAASTPRGLVFMIWWINLGGLLPVMFLYTWNAPGSLFVRNHNALDVMRFYVLLCVANAISYVLDQSTFLWMLGIAVAPELLLRGMAQRSSGDQEAINRDIRDSSEVSGGEP